MLIKLKEENNGYSYANGKNKDCLLSREREPSFFFVV